MQYKIMGSVKKIRMKVGCLPSRFEDQTCKRKILLSKMTSPIAVKKQKTSCSNEETEEILVIQPESSNKIGIFQFINIVYMHLIEKLPTNQSIIIDHLTSSIPIIFIHLKNVHYYKLLKIYHFQISSMKFKFMNNHHVQIGMF